MGDVATLRLAVTAAAAALPGWSVSKFAPELFGRDTDKLSHLAFVVGVPSTVPKDDRQGLVDGCLVFSTVEVQWSYRLRGDAQSGDYNLATDAEQALVKAVVAVSSQHILVQQLVRAARAEGWVIGKASFRVLHRYALS